MSIQRKTPLKRSTKPLKRTPLKRSTKPIARGGPLKSAPKTVEKRSREQALLDQARDYCQSRDKLRRLAGRCIACAVGIKLKNGEFGSQAATAYNHCIPRSRLHGEANWKYLHSPMNLAPTCQAHHDEHDRHPEWWLPLMAKVYGYDYSDEPFAVYLTEVYQRGVTYDTA